MLAAPRTPASITGKAQGLLVGLVRPLRVPLHPSCHSQGGRWHQGHLWLCWRGSRGGSPAHQQHGPAAETCHSSSHTQLKLSARPRHSGMPVGSGLAERRPRVGQVALSRGQTEATSEESVVRAAGLSSARTGRGLPRLGLGSQIPCGPGDPQAAGRWGRVGSPSPAPHPGTPSVCPRGGQVGVPTPRGWGRDPLLPGPRAGAGTRPRW